MKRTLTALMLAALPALAQPALAADLTVTVNGIQPLGGTLLVGLQTEAQFLQHDGIAGTKETNPQSGTQVFTLNNVPAGTYSLSVLHDEDNNGTMNSNASGYPLEGWSIVNAASLRGMPTFDVVSFEVAEDGGSISVDMIYPSAEMSAN